MRLALLPAVLLLGACAEDAETSYDRFNAEGETLSVSVGDEEPGELLSIDLHSSTGAVLIGVASVDPDAGPSGTIHLLEVQILEDFVHQVDKVSVEIEAPERGIQTYTLQGDSADEALYRLEIESVAGDGELRNDTLEIQVWDLSGDLDSPS
jgi:hypothetical protein